MIDEFPLINKISKIHRNFVAVEEIKSKLQGLDTRLADVDRMLLADSGDCKLIEPFAESTAAKSSVD